MQKFIVILSILVLFLLFSCSSNTTETNDQKPYVSLSVGDVTQFIYLKDSSTTLFKIIGKEQRKDGKSVFQGILKYGTEQVGDTSYYFIDNEFYISTELDTVKDDSLSLDINPFEEQRLAKIFPEEADTWVHTLGRQDSVFFRASKADSFAALFGAVNDVYGFSLFDEKNASSSSLTIYYGKGLGWIGSEFNSNEDIFLCSYKNVSGNSYGGLWPEKDISFFPEGAENKTSPEKLIFNNMIQKITGEIK